MKSIKTYIINLESSNVRREYMENLLSPYRFLDIEFIKAIDGRKLAPGKRNELFDNETCLSLIGRIPNGGEIGCTLSHRKCCEALLMSDAPFAIVFEDDISIVRDLNYILDYNINKIIDKDDPIVIMLSGDYWYWFDKNIVSVYDCIGAYAYIINRKAAKLIISRKAASVADNWRFFKSKGLKIKAIKPYMVDANLKMDLLHTDVAQDRWGICRKHMSISNIINGYWVGMIKHLLKLFGHFESKIRVINNQIVDK